MTDKKPPVKQVRTEAQKRADKRYYATVTRKVLNFNAAEQDLLAFVQQLPNFSQWVKDKIRNELENS